MSMEPVTARDIRNPDHPITCLTCYDFLTARVMDEVTELDMVLVGDTLGMVMLGEDDTLSVTVDDMVHHTRAVSNGVERAFIVSDIPYLEMARSRDHLVEIVQRLVGEGGAQGIKIEGGERNVEAIEHLVSHDVPVVGHLGLTPQSVETIGGYKVQGRSEETIRRLGRDARLLEEAGAIGIVLECVPRTVAKKITEMISIPTIGIGAGPDCDGQVLVWQDMLGLTEESPPTFVREWNDLGAEMESGIKQFCDAVKGGDFPGEDETFTLPEEITPDQVEEWLRRS